MTSFRMLIETTNWISTLFYVSESFCQQHNASNDIVMITSKTASNQFTKMKLNDLICGNWKFEFRKRA